MALDRQSIEKRDFPIGRRGYEPASVDAHLSSIATEVEALQRAKSEPASAFVRAPGAAPETTPAASLASVASVQVQAIVEAAELTAAAIETEARERAEQVQEDAAGDAQRIRDEAIVRSQEHIGQVHEATSLMLQRVDAMESELGALVDSLRTGANRVGADLYLVSSTMSDLYEAVGGPQESGPLPGDPPEAVDVFAPEFEPEPEPDPEPESAPATSRAQSPSKAARAEEHDDVEGARLIALNMALNGQTREETDRYLANNFVLADRAGLLEEVYATVDG